jgi:histidine ammonia-lyase
MATHGARRVAAMAANVQSIVAIELLTACQGIDFRKPLKTSAPLTQAHEAMRQAVPFAQSDRLLAADIAAASGVLRTAPIQDLTADLLPSRMRPQ